MAVVQSTSNSTWASANSIVITKPTGLVVGDLLVAILSYKTNTTTVTPPAGWTLIRDSDYQGIVMSTYYKVANSSDVAATNFTFGLSATVNSVGALLRIDGYPAGMIVETSSEDSTENSVTTVTFETEISVTPYITGSLLVFATATSQITTNGSGYAIVTSNPTWTEFVDTSAGAGACTFLGAYATRTEITATGNLSFTVGSSTQSYWTGQVLVFAPSKDVTVSETISTVESIQRDISLSRVDGITLTEIASLSISRLWTKVTKPITTWTKRSKN